MKKNIFISIMMVIIIMMVMVSISYGASFTTNNTIMTNKQIRKITNLKNTYNENILNIIKDKNWYKISKKKQNNLIIKIEETGTNLKEIWITNNNCWDFKDDENLKQIAGDELDLGDLFARGEAGNWVLFKDSVTSAEKLLIFVDKLEYNIEKNNAVEGIGNEINFKELSLKRINLTVKEAFGDSQFYRQMPVDFIYEGLNSPLVIAKSQYTNELLVFIHNK